MGNTTNIICSHCRGEQFTITQAGPHRKLSCAKCKRYIKFITKEEESFLKKNNSIQNRNEVQGETLF